MINLLPIPYKKMDVLIQLASIRQRKISLNILLPIQVCKCSLIQIKIIAYDYLPMLKEFKKYLYKIIRKLGAIYL